MVGLTAVRDRPLILGRESRPVRSPVVISTHATGQVTSAGHLPGAVQRNPAWGSSSILSNDFGFGGFTRDSVTP